MEQQAISEWLCHYFSLNNQDKIKQPPASIWDDVCQILSEHALTSLFYKRLKKFPTLAIPPNTKQELQAKHTINSVRSMYFEYQFTEILTAFQKQNIPVIVLKGAYLAHVIYGDTSIRPMYDMDFLVRKTDLTRAMATMQELGYSLPRELWLEAEYAIYYGLPAFSKDNAVPVEIHWHIEFPYSPFTIDIDELWVRAEFATVGGVEILTFSPEDLLLHLCLHTSFHHRFYIGIRALCDITETIRHYQDRMDWDKVSSLTRQWGATNFVYLTLYMAKELLAADVPDALLNELKPANIDPDIISWARKQILAGQGDTPPLYNFARVWGAKTLQEKIAVFVKAVFPSPLIMSTMYPVPPSSKRIYLYYPVRIKDLFVRYRPTIWQLLHSDEKTISSTNNEYKSRDMIDRLTS